jgi:hypothetical protein
MPCGIEFMCSHYAWPVKTTSKNPRARPNILRYRHDVPAIFLQFMLLKHSTVFLRECSLSARGGTTISNEQIASTDTGLAQPGWQFIASCTYGYIWSMLSITRHAKLARVRGRRNERGRERRIHARRPWPWWACRAGRAKSNMKSARSGPINQSAADPEAAHISRQWGMPAVRQFSVSQMPLSLMRFLFWPDTLR